jgi:hypothetical protein
VIEGNEHAGEDTRNRPAALRSRSESSLRLETVVARGGERSSPHGGWNGVVFFLFSIVCLNI